MMFTNERHTTARLNDGLQGTEATDAFGFWTRLSQRYMKANAVFADLDEWITEETWNSQ